MGSFEGEVKRAERGDLCFLHSNDFLHYESLAGEINQCHMGYQHEKQACTSRGHSASGLKLSQFQFYNSS